MRRARTGAAITALTLVLLWSRAFAGAADVLAATARRQADGSYEFEVTVRHADEGWDHYADAWQIIGPDGAVLATRTLAHPHVDEQPVTRSLDGVHIPDGVDRVTVRAHDSRHGLGGREVVVILTRTP